MHSYKICGLTNVLLFSCLLFDVSVAVPKLFHIITGCISVAFAVCSPNVLCMLPCGCMTGVCMCVYVYSSDLHYGQFISKE
jgi:hypothetical protein